ncbi:MAG: hypothetical protein ACI8YQ_003537 [Polaribacter sp.]|jgi:hypothetical protein
MTNQIGNGFVLLFYHKVHFKNNKKQDANTKEDDGIDVAFYSEYIGNQVGEEIREKCQEQTADPKRYTKN